MNYSDEVYTDQRRQQLINSKELPFVRLINFVCYVMYPIMAYIAASITVRQYFIDHIPGTEFGSYLMVTICFYFLCGVFDGTDKNYLNNFLQKYNFKTSVKTNTNARNTINQSDSTVTSTNTWPFFDFNYNLGLIERSSSYEDFVDYHNIQQQSEMQQIKNKRVELMFNILMMIINALLSLWGFYCYLNNSELSLKFEKYYIFWIALSCIFLSAINSLMFMFMIICKK